MELTDLFFLRASSAIVLVGLLWYLHKLLHRNEISFTLGVVWSVALLGALLLTLVPSILAGISENAGAELPVHFLFFVACFFLVLLTFGLTLKSARQERQIIRLTQEIALVSERLERISAAQQSPQDTSANPLGLQQRRANE